MIDDEDEDEYSLCATVTDGRPYLAMVHHRVGHGRGMRPPRRHARSFCEHAVAVGLAYLFDEGLPGG